MPDPKPRFVWYELMTSDPEAAEAFYRAVVGWSTSDAGQPHMRYTVLSAGGRGVGGIMAIPEEAAKGGMRPGWLGYVGVSDTDAAAERIVEGGGVLHRGPADIPNVGRFAVVADPGGALFQLLTPLPQEDAAPPLPPGAPGGVSWHELYAGVGEAAAFRFYAEQFGWETLDLIDMGPMGQYRIFGIDGEGMGGMMDKPDGWPVSAWSFYVDVDAIDAATGRILANGGHVRMGPREVPDKRWIVQAEDPQGASFALVSARR